MKRGDQGKVMDGWIDQARAAHLMRSLWFPRPPLRRVVGKIRRVAPAMWRRRLVSRGGARRRWKGRGWVGFAVSGRSEKALSGLYPQKGKTESGLQKV